MIELQYIENGKVETINPIVSIYATDEGLWVNNGYSEYLIKNEDLHLIKFKFLEENLEN